MNPLWIVSVGPGRPEWMTLEAVERIQACDVVAVPQPRAEEHSLAERVAEKFIPKTSERLYLELPMSYDVTLLETRWKEAAEAVWQRMKAGKQVALLVLGDASLFGTSAYIAGELKAAHPEAVIEVTPGVISPTACAARLGLPLATGNQNVTIVPDSELPDQMDRAIAMGGTVILMKISRSLQHVIRHLEERDLLQHARVVIRGGQPGERIVTDLRELRGENIPYMSLAILKVPETSEPEEMPIEPLAAAAPLRPKTGGKVFLVGFGPGHREHLTYRARQAILASDVVVGYVTYLNLIKELLPGKEIVRGGMTEEVSRAVTAVEKAREGKVVSLISSGDAGIYGMAAPTYEVLMEAGWTPGEPPEVEVVPGVTAISAVSSVLGAPLAHDFCAISLSDLLTPWEVIEKRLEAAASSDLITGLYNPKSGRRTQQLMRAQEIFLKHRSPKTPVGIVKSCLRKRQVVDITTLDRIQEFDIGMLTTVLIGNSSTVTYKGLMVTPRGYKRKYDLKTAEVKSGLNPSPVGGDWSLGRGKEDPSP